MTAKKSIAEICVELKNIHELGHPLLEVYKQDERKGVQKALQSWMKNYEQQQKLKDKWNEMTIYEKKAWNEGYQFIAGVDEVGRGPLVGPVVAAAVILPQDFILLGLDDSKKISETKRESYYEQIMSQAIAVGVGIIHNNIIDEINIYEATKKAMLEALKQLQVAADYVLIDAMTLPLHVPQQSIIKGDAKSVSISAASVVAKVTRDRMMNEYDQQYPQYGFKKNMGYGTKEHLEGLKNYGITPWHRLSFAPVKEIQEGKK